MAEFIFTMKGVTKVHPPDKKVVEDLFGLYMEDAGRLPEAAVDPLDAAARRLERIILGLRTRTGIPVAWLPAGALDLERGRQEGLWSLERERLASLRERGILTQDELEGSALRRGRARPARAPGSGRSCRA